MLDPIKKEIKQIIKRNNLECTIDNFKYRANWDEISLKENFSNEFAREFQNNLDWYIISSSRALSVDFMREFKHRIYFNIISKTQKLPESFIIEFKDKLDWEYISTYQKLSERFINDFEKKVDWNAISFYQELSENFITYHQKKVFWSAICICQKLSEGFIERFEKKVNWNNISMFQILSEDFIEKHIEKLNGFNIFLHQKLSIKFLNKYNIIIPESCWLYKSGDEKLEAVRQCGLYTIEGDYVIAYKGVRRDNYSFFNFQYKYEVGQSYEAHADHNINRDFTYGLSAWTYEGSKRHCPEMILKLRIHKDDIAALVNNKNNLRATKIEVLEIVETN